MTASKQNTVLRSCDWRGGHRFVLAPECTLDFSYPNRIWMISVGNVCVAGWMLLYYILNVTYNSKAAGPFFWRKVRTRPSQQLPAVPPLADLV